jgi:hypothetical protein
MTMPVAYSIEVVPPRVLVGEPVSANLRCVATASAPGVLTFEHRSLVVELNRAGLIEPSIAFPNSRAVEVGEKLIRFSSSGGVEDLAAGDERVRTFDLVSLFPDIVLGVGKLAVTYCLEEVEPPLSVKPALLEVSSGPEAIPHLLERLGDTSPTVRACAMAVLGQMTAQDFGYDPDAPASDRELSLQRWRDWWGRTGSRMPWSYDSEGATFGVPPGTPPASRRSEHLGGIAYPVRP